jgi:hypothetical protein
MSQSRMFRVFLPRCVDATGSGWCVEELTVLVGPGKEQGRVKWDSTTYQYTARGGRTYTKMNRRQAKRVAKYLEADFVEEQNRKNRRQKP